MNVADGMLGMATYSHYIAHIRTYVAAGYIRGEGDNQNLGAGAKYEVV